MLPNATPAPRPTSAAPAPDGRAARPGHPARPGRPARTARRALRGVGAVVVASLLLAGCVAGRETTEVTPSGASAPPADVTALLPPNLDDALLGFYQQQVVWSACDGELECATIDVPVDWADGAGPKASVALKRQPAQGSADEREGSLLINPGGPGGSGLDFLSGALSLISPSVQERYDVVAFDPRGVGQSTPVTCVDDARKDELLSKDYALGTQAGRDEYVADRTELGAACLANTGDLLAHVDTQSAAKDMDLIRVLVGDERLTYLGYSYGTQLGATYAGLFPAQVGRFVLDGAVDVTLDSDGSSLGQAEGFERALRAYVTDCQAGSACPLTGSVDDGLAQIKALTERAYTDPLRTSDGSRVLTRTLAFYGVAVALYADENWPLLTQALRAAIQSNDGTSLLALADFYNSRNFDGTFSDNGTEAFAAIGCADDRVPDDVATMEKVRDEILAVAPTLGESFAWGGLFCAGWPTDPVTRSYDVAAPGAAPILVLGTTNDPATPYEWAQALAKTLESATLVTWEGEGHTSYGRSNDCIADAVDAYLLEGTVPAEGLVC